MRNSDRGNRFGGRRDGGRRDGGRPTMYQAVCAECGKDCEVPFQPTGDKPVYCSTCFGNKGGNERRSQGRDFGRSDFREKRMFSAICDKCHKQCEVPFRPTEGKPVFCDACFGPLREASKGSSGQEKRTGPSNADQLTAINAKLDKIMNSLTAAGLISSSKNEKVNEAKTEKPAAKKAAPKKKADKKKKK